MLLLISIYLRTPQSARAAATPPLPIPLTLVEFGLIPRLIFLMFGLSRHSEDGCLEQSPDLLFRRVGYAPPDDRRTLGVAPLCP